MSINDLTLNPLQQNIMDSDADITGFGGASGIGRTTTAHVLAYRKHKKSIIFSNDWQLTLGTGMELFSESDAAWLHTPLRKWKFRDDRFLRLGTIEHPRDAHRYQGSDFDGMFFDGVDDMDPQNILQVMAWNRSGDATVKPQCYMLFHVPNTVKSLWLYNLYAPWIDSDHPNPASDGEKRWMVCHEGNWIEVPTQSPIEFPKIFEKHGHARIWTDEKLTYYPRSVTFYRGTDDDIQLGDEYKDLLSHLPRPLCYQLLNGDFTKVELVEPDVDASDTSEIDSLIADTIDPRRSEYEG